MSFALPDEHPAEPGSVTSILDKAIQRVGRSRRSATAWVRPHFARPALAAACIGVGLMLAPVWPLFLFAPPTLVIACRYYELARFAPVRPSRWLFLLVLVAAGASILWTLDHNCHGMQLPLQLGIVGGFVAAGAHLWRTQLRLRDGQMRLALPGADDDLEPRWVFGGMLALLPILFLWGFAAALATWRNPAALLSGFAALGLLALQVHAHRWFPRLAILWLMLQLWIEARSGLPDDTASGDGELLSGINLLAVLCLSAYLEFHPRARRTFLGAAPVDPAAAPVDAVPLGAATRRRV